MHFSDTHEGNSSKFTKIAIVAALHVAVAGAVIHSMNTRTLVMPKVDDLVTVFIPEEIKETPPPPPEPPKPTPKTVQPDLIAPPPEVVVPQQPSEPAPAAQFTTEAPPVADPAPAAPAAAPSENTGAMRTAVLADASACAKPDYPARAARNGETGTVSLALLVGTDGRVAGSRIQSSSGSRELDKAAVQALSMCKFKPATTGGVPEQAWAQIAYVWTLD